MPTDRQLAANRQNAQKSTGPKTPEGRAAVRLNGVKHGLTASTIILPGESESDFESLLHSFESEHNPSTPTEQALVRQMAMAQWRLLRLYRVEAAFFDLRLAESDRFAGEIYKSLDDTGRLAYIVNNSPQTLTNLSRIEARLERSFHKALQELRRLRAALPQKVENQTQSQEQPVNPPPPPPLPPQSEPPCRDEQSPPSSSPAGVENIDDTPHSFHPAGRSR